MKQFSKFLTLIACMLFLFNTVQAVPAYPGIIQKVQSDGTTLELYLFGDEFFSWAQTLDGYTILCNEFGDHVYMCLDEFGDLVYSDIIAHSEKNRTTSEKLFLSTIIPKLFFSKSQKSFIDQIVDIKKNENRDIPKRAYPTTGDRTHLCILMQYPDQLMVKTKQEFENLLNVVGYNTGGASGSFKDFYLEASYNQLNMTCVVIGPYTSANNMSYYANRASTLLSEGLSAANAEFDFSPYDTDGDGYIDGIHMIFAGYGQESTGNTSNIWSHMSYMSSSPLVDGVRGRLYACSPELRGSGGTNLTHVGVVCHEFGHVLGAPDYYDTNDNTGGSYDGTGQWDLMASGSWNGGGALPAHPNGYVKTHDYGWASATVLNEPNTITLKNAAFNSDSYYRVDTKTNGEYFLIENRQKVGFDAQLPGQGMVIYHVHKDIGGISSNVVNATHPQKMYPVNAGATSDAVETGNYGTINGSSLPFPYSSKNSFTDNTIPSSRSWALTNTEKPITNIARSGQLITFEILGGYGNPLTFAASTVSQNQINVTWSQTQLNTMILAYSTDGVFGTPEAGVTYTAGMEIEGGGTVLYAGSDLSFNHTGLYPSTSYYYKIWGQYNDNSGYSTGKETAAYTQCGEVTVFPYQESFGTGVKPSCFGNNTDSTNSNRYWRFDNPAKRPFISASEKFMIIDAEYNGSSTRHNASIVSNTFDFSQETGVHVYFRHYFRHRNNVVEEGGFYYSLDGGSTFTLIAKFDTTVGSFTAPAQAYYDLSGSLAGQSNVQFMWHYQTTNGFYWCIDDFIISDVLGIDDPAGISSLSIYPNPSTGIINIDNVEGSMTYRIFDISGRFIRTGKLEIGINQVNIEDLESGIYYIHVESNSSKKAYPIIKN